MAVCANAAEALPALLESSLAIDVVTDQTSAHDPLNGYIPAGLSLEDAASLRASDPEAYMRRSRESMARHCEAMVEYQRRGAEVFDYGNSLRDQARIGGFADAFAYPGFVPAYIRDQFCEGRGPFRWVALSGDPEDIARTDAAMLELFPDHDGLHRWLSLAKERVHFQGLPARICWLGAGERHLAGLRFNDMVRSGELSAPVVIGRDHLDSGSVASPLRETEAMRDGSDAIADWPVLNALLNTASGATWVAVHHGGGVGMGLLDSRRRAGVRRRQRALRATLRARAHQRPVHRRHAPRGRGLPGSARARLANAECASRCSTRRIQPADERSRVDRRGRNRTRSRAPRRADLEGLDHPGRNRGRRPRRSARRCSASPPGTPSGSSTSRRCTSETSAMFRAIVTTPTRAQPTTAFRPRRPTLLAWRSMLWSWVATTH